MNFLDIIFPRVCLGCKKEGGYICTSCLSKVEIINEFDPKTQTFSIFKYEGVIRKAIIKIKYNFAFDIAKELSEICTVQIIKSQLNIKNSIIVPIPLHKTRENWRGFNQSEILAELMSKKLNIEFENNLLTRPIQGKTQVGLAYSERVRNICGKFAVNTSTKKSIRADKTYIIFDDVATTGSTIQEATKILKKFGARKVFGLTIAS